jgi:GTPase
MSLPIVAIIGRPNVGKSSLFNRLIGQNLAVVDPQSGVTRDRNYSPCTWNGMSFYLVDTGGMATENPDDMEKLILDQSTFAVEEADLVIMLVDVQVGMSTSDQSIARTLRKATKPCILVGNKADNTALESSIHDFHTLGLGDPMAVSATGGRGIGELLDSIVARLSQVAPPQLEVDAGIRVAVVGRPNVGKSSFINKLLGESRLIVSPMAGTTRDAVDTPLVFDEQKYTLIDTAGLRRRYRISESIEYYTTLRTTRAIEGCDVAIVMIDGIDGLTTQDQRVLSQVLEARRSAVLVVNKWDLVEKDGRTADEYTKAINLILARHDFVPVIYISSLTGQRVAKVMQLVKTVYDESRRQIGTSEINDFLQKVVARRHPPAVGAKYIKLNYMVQTETGPPTFVVFCNHPRFVDKQWVRYLVNQIHEEYGFSGVPFRVKFRQK